MKQEQLTDIFTIENGRPIWQTNYRDKFIEFLQAANPEKLYECTVKPVENQSEYFQHKFYRGYLLPEIARESYDGINAKAHLALKNLFLRKEVKGWEDIPKKHQSRCIPIIRETQIDETGEVIQEVYAYLPSTADLTRKEFEDYIEQVLRLCEDMGLQVSISPSGQECYRWGFMEEAV